LAKAAKAQNDHCRVATGKARNKLRSGSRGMVGQVLVNILAADTLQTEKDQSKYQSDP
jgi:hypothetical protein